MKYINDRKADQIFPLAEPGAGKPRECYAAGVTMTEVPRTGPACGAMMLY